MAYTSEGRISGCCSPPTRYPNGLPGGVPSRYFDDPKEAEEAMKLAKRVIDLVEKEIKKAKP
jgi:HEPN domain-containing protein